MEQSPATVVEIASGKGWRVRDITCHARMGERDFEERHDRFLIAVVRRGTFTYHGRQARDLLYEGAILLGNSGTCYSCGHHHGDGDQCLALQLDDNVFEDIASTAAGSMTYKFTTSSLPLHRDLLAAFAPLEQAVTADHVTAVEESVITFADKVLRKLSGTTPRSNTQWADRKRVEDVLRHLADGTLADPSLASLAIHARMSKYHFLRVFKSVTGTTPHQHLLTMRMRHAAQLLRETKMPVTTIAYDCGFSDLSTFNRTFKATYGKSPRQSRS